MHPALPHQKRVCCGQYLLDPLHKCVLIEGNCFCALLKMVLVPETQLQHLLGVQLFQFGVGWRGLPTEESYKAREGPELI